MLAPNQIQKIGPELAIVWNDGSETYIPLEKLRRKCPCAVCRESEPDGQFTELDQQFIKPESEASGHLHFFSPNGVNPSRTDDSSNQANSFGKEISETSSPLDPTGFELTGWELVGNYGFQPKWGDDHRSGIFTWAVLKAYS